MQQVNILAFAWLALKRETCVELFAVREKQLSLSTAIRCTFLLGGTMNFDAVFFLNSILLGTGLAMDAFSVSMANGLNEPRMKRGRQGLIAGVFALFQFAMPMIGWICVHTVLQLFEQFSILIPWIALILLCYIGISMIREGMSGDEEEEAEKEVGNGKLFVQGIATSIDALSVGFTIAHYNMFMALISTLIIGAVTFVICLAGLEIGKKFGMKLAGKASIFGGVILILIGLEIFISGVFF